MLQLLLSIYFLNFCWKDFSFQSVSSYWKDGVKNKTQFAMERSRDRFKKKKQVHKIEKNI